MIPDDAWPAGDRMSWDDDETRTVWDFTAEPPWAPSRPYTDEENAAADARAAVAERAAAPVVLREEIAVLLDQEPNLERTMALVEALARLALEVP